MKRAMIANRDKLSSVRILLSKVALMAIATTVTAAEDVDEFSRANCFNNESITYDFFSPPITGQVISWHFDTENGDALHFVAASQPIYCYGGFRPDCPMTCYVLTDCRWPLVTQTRIAAIHNTEDGVPLPNVSTRWRVHGRHNRTLIDDFGYPIYWVSQTDATDCNLHFDQFY